MRPVLKPYVFWSCLLALGVDSTIVHGNKRANVRVTPVPVVLRQHALGVRRELLWFPR